MPVRPYQFAMAATALRHNALISLPTGLGKTLIGAVVLLNFYRWYPAGKVLFIAPTKPLVKQQFEACRSATSIPDRDVAMLTGNSGAASERNAVRLGDGRRGGKGRIP